MHQPSVEHIVDTILAFLRLYVTLAVSPLETIHWDIGTNAMMQAQD